MLHVAQSSFDFSAFVFIIITVISSVLSYEVGVDYHSCGANFVQAAFLTQYHNSTVRAIVLTQLQGMANKGAHFVTLDIWFGVEPNTTSDQYWLATFPISRQEQINLHQYALDVASIQSQIDQHRLRLNVALFWLAAADYRVGNTSSGYGPDHLNATVFTARVEKITDDIITAVSDVKRSDGVLVVERIYLDYEVMIGAKLNQDWFLQTHYPRFLRVVAAADFTPSLYFLVDAKEAHILDASYIDPQYPALNGHRCMYWVYRSLKFLNDVQLPLPTRIDFSCYIDRNSSTYAHLVNHVLNDADAALSTLGAPKLYGVAETYYFANNTQRREYGQAFALEAMANPRLNHLRFWTTPDAGGKGVHIGYPFEIEDYLPPSDTQLP
ncbi:unnamed protein product [Adineta ricciae]|uniref:Uncharacterized protein n=1 Tax=Adineta ricciae TaxID=249248 RepID=A0A814V725_ADIRI|nr:unnamed protein product [Adineta ricciae]CAF1342553.1 unnamed protein product [Adineta ricciae]